MRPSGQLHDARGPFHSNPSHRPPHGTVTVAVLAIRMDADDAMHESAPEVLIARGPIVLSVLISNYQ